MGLCWVRVVVHDCAENSGEQQKSIFYNILGSGEEKKHEDRRDVGHAEPHLSVAS